MRAEVEDEDGVDTGRPIPPTNQEVRDGWFISKPRLLSGMRPDAKRHLYMAISILSC